MQKYNSSRKYNSSEGDFQKYNSSWKYNSSIPDRGREVPDRASEEIPDRGREVHDRASAELHDKANFRAQLPAQRGETREPFFVSCWVRHRSSRGSGSAGQRRSQFGAFLSYKVTGRCLGQAGLRRRVVKQRSIFCQAMTRRMRPVMQRRWRTWPVIQRSWRT